MRTQFKESFVRDLKRISVPAVNQRVRRAIQAVEEADGVQDLPNIRKLRGGDRHYRIRIGDYRIGLLIEGETAEFVRCLHRRDLYRFFP